MVVGGGERGRRGRTLTFCSQHHRVVNQVQHCSTCARSNSSALSSFRIKFFLLRVAPGPPTPHRSWSPAPPHYLQFPKSSNHTMSLFLRCPSPSSPLLTLLSSRKPPQLPAVLPPAFLLGLSAILCTCCSHSTSDVSISFQSGCSVMV